MAKPSRPRAATRKQRRKSPPRGRRTTDARRTIRQDEVAAWLSGAWTPARARRRFTLLKPELPSWNAPLAFNAGRARVLAFEA